MRFTAFMGRSFGFLCFLLSFHGLWAQNRFSKEQVLEDLAYLKTSLEQTHYNLYAYTPRQEFDQNYDRVKGSIRKDSLSLLEVTSLYQKVISKANNGHTEIPFPGASYMQYASDGGTVFPLEIAFEGQKSWVRKNWSEFGSIRVGSEIRSIDGMPMDKILSDIYPQVSAERPYFKNAKIELYSFPRLYWQVYGRKDVFEVEIAAEGTVKSYSLKAVPAIEGYEMKRNEVINPERKLEFLEKSAYLNPGGFGGDEKLFRQFIDSAFAAIKQERSKNLIIDLRNNPGGDDSFSDYLVSYIADKPFHWTSGFSLKTSELLKQQARQQNDPTSPYWQSILSHDTGETYGYAFEAYPPQSLQKRFTGDVFVLVNRQSHSQSAVTAAQIQDYGFGTIVGEETGDYPSLYASQFRYTLPKTGIRVMVSKGYITRVNGNTEEKGVIPDLFIKDHLLDEKDEILDGLLAKMNGQF